MSCTGGNAGSAAPPPASSGPRTLEIGLIAPLSGPLSSVGRAVRDSAQLAVDEANTEGTVAGWRLVLHSIDDQGDPNAGVQAATTLAATRPVVGVIGPAQSSVARQVAPILSTDHVAEISPATADPTLTRGDQYRSDPQRPYPSFFRVIPTDEAQANYAADFAIRSLQARTAYLIDDQQTYGLTLVDEFAREFARLGGRVITTVGLPLGQKDTGALIADIARTAPDLVYFGGQESAASQLLKQMRLTGQPPTFLGGDVLLDPDFVKAVGSGAGRVYATQLGAPVRRMPGGNRFLVAHAAAGYGRTASTDSALAYDATNVLLSAVGSVVSGHRTLDEGARAAIIDAVQRTSTSGVSGSISFDRYGDTTSRVITMYQLEDGDLIERALGDATG
jgi:branched-chain amino acid transport system substrate-binding protein